MRSASKFTDKSRLIEFFYKARELFPDTLVEALDPFDHGDHAIVEWNLTSTKILSYRPSQPRVSISLRGATIVHVFNGITEWSDYYDQLASRRTGLAAFFTEWIEY
jgi:hypothetical protein